MRESDMGVPPEAAEVCSGRTYQIDLKNHAPVRRPGCGGEAEDGIATVGDAIDQWLGFLCGPAPEEQDRRLEALPGGTVLHVHATDNRLGGDGE